MAVVRVGINGFGRIGRVVFRVLASRPEERRELREHEENDQGDQKPRDDVGDRACGSEQRRDRCRQHEDPGADDSVYSDRDQAEQTDGS